MLRIDENDYMVSVHAESMMGMLDMECDTVNNNFHSRFLNSDFGPNKLGHGNDCGRDVIEKSIMGDRDAYLKFVVPKIESLSHIKGKGFADHEQLIQMTKRRRVKRSFGDEIDIHAVNQGRLDRAWGTTERVQIDSRHRLVTLLIQNNASWKENAYDSYWTSAVAVRLVDELQKAGKSVQLIIGSIQAGSMQRSNKTISVTTTIKRYGDNLSIERLVGMTHLGFFRSFNFIEMCLQPHALNANLGYAAGFDISRPETNMPMWLMDEIKAGYTKPILLTKSNSIETAAASIQSAYEQLAI